MAYSGQLSRQQRGLSASGAVIVVLAVGIGLASGFDLGSVRKASEAMTALSFPAPPQAEAAPEPVAKDSDRPSGEASAENLHAKAAPIAAPKPKLPPLAPPPIAAAPKPGTGNDGRSGASSNPGSGTGAGGRGDGFGSGGAGRGTGGGTKAVWRSGSIRDRDYPKSASRSKTGGEVEVRFTIQATGRVNECRVTRSSGDASLDATTCNLIEERFRFEPATNAAGDAISSPYGWRQSWWLEGRR